MGYGGLENDACLVGVSGEYKQLIGAYKQYVNQSSIDWSTDPISHVSPHAHTEWVTLRLNVWPFDLCAMSGFPICPPPPSFPSVSPLKHQGRRSTVYSLIFNVTVQFYVLAHTILWHRECRIYSPEKALHNIYKYTRALARAHTHTIDKRIKHVCTGLLMIIKFRSMTLVLKEYFMHTQL